MSRGLFHNTRAHFYVLGGGRDGGHPDVPGRPWQPFMFRSRVKSTGYWLNDKDCCVSSANFLVAICRSSSPSPQNCLNTLVGVTCEVACSSAGSRSLFRAADLDQGESILTFSVRKSHVAWGHDCVCGGFGHAFGPESASFPPVLIVVSFACVSIF